MSLQPSPSALLAPFSAAPVFISVDLDSWIHCRWASGTTSSLWSSSIIGYQEIYGVPRPGRDFDEAIDRTLALLDEQNLRITFFVLSEIAELFPNLLRRIDELGHEVALHGSRHVDNSYLTVPQFRAMVCSARHSLEDIVGKAVVGYRAPNLILSSEQLSILDEEGFEYDSSVCPSRGFFGKYHNMSGAPTTPYYPSPRDLATCGDLRIIELPLGVFPVIRLPCSTSIMTRVLGSWWARFGLRAMLRNGYASYYFHPYELGVVDAAFSRSFYVRLFLRGCGENFQRQLASLLIRLRQQGQVFRGRDIARAIRTSQDRLSADALDSVSFLKSRALFKESHV